MATDHHINNINQQRKSNDDPANTFRVNMQELSVSIVPTFDVKIIRHIEKNLGLNFILEKVTGNVCFANNNDELREEFKTVFTPYDLLDYIYGVLHSKSQQENHTSLIKSESLLVPYPKDATTFWQLVKLGASLKQTYLLRNK